MQSSRSLRAPTVEEHVHRRIRLLFSITAVLRLVLDCDLRMGEDLSEGQLPRLAERTAVQSVTEQQARPGTSAHEAWWMAGRARARDARTSGEPACRWCSHVRSCTRSSITWSGRCC